MSTITISPSTVYSEGIWYEVPNAGSHASIVSDSSDSTYLTTDPGDPAQTDLYNFSHSLPANIVINSITVWTRIKATSSVHGGAGPAILIGGSNYYDEVLASSITNVYKTWTTNPSAGVAWTYSDLSSLKFGVRIQPSLYTYYNACYGVWMVIDYTLVPPSGGAQIIGLELL